MPEWVYNFGYFSIRELYSLLEVGFFSHVSLISLLVVQFLLKKAHELLKASSYHDVDLPEYYCLGNQLKPFLFKAI